MINRNGWSSILSAGLLLALVSCNIPTVAVGQPTLTATAPAILPATNTPVVQVSTATGESGETQAIQTFLIRLEDNGASGPPVGCGDSLVGVVSDQPAVGSIEEQIRQAYQMLFQVDPAMVENLGLYNALTQSQLQVSGVTVSGSMAEVRLSGQFLLGGTCDTPRFQAQLAQTALQFVQIEQAQIFLNDVRMEDALSQQ